MDPYIQYMYSYPHKTAYGPLTGISLKDYGAQLAGPGHSLYLHIPFCQTKCGYCDLFSVTGQSRQEIDRYLDAVERQILQYAAALAPFKTCFSDLTIGGGTPLLLSEAQLRRVFSMLFAHLPFEKERKIVIETAPAQTTAGKLKILKEVGVTRISMGIQSFFDAELQTLKRQHLADCARRALELLMTFAFPCVNVDLIYGIPGQTADTFLASVKEAAAFGVEEIFLYPLYIRHGARLERELAGRTQPGVRGSADGLWAEDPKQVRDLRQKKGEGVQKGLQLDPESAFLQYREAAAFLQKEGFRQDSMRRFVRMGAFTGDLSGMCREAGQRADTRRFEECGFGTSLALGCGGRSYLGGLHFCTPYKICRQDCLDQLRAYEAEEDYLQIRHGISLSKEEEKRRYVIRHLLIRPGLPMERYQTYFGTGAMEDFPLLKEWIQEGYLVLHGMRYGKCGEGEGIEETFLALTDEGLALSDHLGPQLISPAVRRKMEEWEMDNRSSHKA